MESYYTKKQAVKFAKEIVKTKSDKVYSAYLQHNNKEKFISVWKRNASVTSDNYTLEDYISDMFDSHPEWNGMALEFFVKHCNYSSYIAEEFLKKIKTDCKIDL